MEHRPERRPTMSLGRPPLRGAGQLSSRCTTHETIGDEAMSETKETVEIVYTNYRGETAVRKVNPKRIWFGKTDWHPEEQWLLDAFDIAKQADRSFAMKDIRAWLG
jgi:hypothetical protein